MNRIVDNKRLGLIILLGFLSALAPFTIDMYLPSLPTITNNFDTSVSLIQFSITVTLLGLGVGQMIIGPMSDAQGRKRPILTFLLLYFATSIVCAIAPNIYIFIVARFLQGFSVAGGFIVSRAVIRDVFVGRELTKFYALFMLINNLATILGPITGSIVLIFTDWRGVFVLLAIGGGILFVIVKLKFKETLPPENRASNNLKSTFKNFLIIMKDRKFMGYALTQGFITAAAYAYVSGTPFVYQNIYGLSPQLFSLLFSLNGVGIISGTILISRFSEIVAERTFLKVGLFIGLTGSSFLMLAIIFNGPIFSIVVSLFFIISSMGLISTSAFSLALQTQDHLSGSAAALFGLFPLILGAITTPLVGIRGENTAVPMGIIIFSACILSILSYYILVVQAKETSEKYEI